MSGQGEFDFASRQAVANAAHKPQFPAAAPVDPAVPGLYLKSITLTNVRQFRQPLRLTGLAPGLNIVAGPNESGKSTIARAVRAAFFERHRSKVVDDLRPLGDSAAMPEVALTFALHGQTAQLHKAFLTAAARCDLQWGSQHWTGAEAEEQLAQWLGYQYAAKGVSRPEHWGIPGLLWVEQGKVDGLAEAASHARDPLQQALQTPAVANPLHQAAVQLAASEGDRLLERWQTERKRHLTDTGKPRGDFSDTLAMVAQLRSEVGQLDQVIASYQADVDALAQVSQQLHADATTRPWQAAQQQLDAALQTQQQIAAQTQRQRELLQAQSALAQQLSWLQTQAAQAQSQRDVLAQRHLRADDLRQQLQAAEQALAQLQTRVTAQQQQWQRSQTDAQTVQLAHSQAMRRLHGQHLMQEAARLTQALAEATQAGEADVQAQQRAKALAKPRQWVAEVHRLHAQCERLQAQLDVASTSVSWQLAPGSAATLQEGDATAVQLPSSGTHALTQTTHVRTASGDVFAIVPGGAADAQSLRTQLQQLRARLAAGLQALGAADLADLDQRVQAAQAAVQVASLASQQLRTLAPHGLAALQAQCAEVQQRVQQAQRDGLLAQADSSPNATPTATAETLAAPSEQAVAQAHAAMLADQQQLVQIEHQWQAQGQASTRLHAELAATVAECERIGAALQTSDAQLQALPQQVLQLGQQLNALDAQLADLAAQLATTNADAVTRAVAQLTQQVQALQASHEERKVQQRLLSQKLQQVAAQMGNHGLEERRAQLQAQLAQAERKSDELGARSRALDVLCRLTVHHRQAALARFESPLFARMQTYVPLVWPDGQVQVDGGLLPQSLHRGAVDLQGMPFDKLSVGAREQLALISRMAYADLLKTAGRPTLIMLDDALVNADADRLAAMKRVLADVATRHQVLVFTCHGEQWQDGIANRYWLPDFKNTAEIG